MLQDVGGVGQRGKVIEVSDGYALNFLIPNGKAVQATPEKEAEAVRKLADSARQASEKHTRLAADLKILNGKKLVIKAKGNEQGHLFKSVKREDIVGNLLDSVAFVTPDMVQGIGAGIKDAGEHVVHIVGAGVDAAVTLVIEAAN